MIENRTWVRIAYCRDIPLREGRAVKVGDRDIAIFNLGDRFVAVENRCPHKSGPLADGIVSGDTVVCPLHAWKMCLDTGKGVNGPSAGRCVETFRTRVEGEIVLLEMNENRSESDRSSGPGLSAMCIGSSEMVAMKNYPSAAEA
jgi:nitrite reductase (NADH) small subunit